MFFTLLKLIIRNKKQVNKIIRSLSLPFLFAVIYTAFKIKRKGKINQKIIENQR